jgi:CMP-N-acetylneuraminic acid synthetase
MTDPAIVVIPARGGSKRFPRKNIALLAGRPLLSYAIDAARAAPTISEVFVSTEDDEIAAIAKECGATVPYMRPAKLAGDTVTADEVVADLVRHVQQTENRRFSVVALIQPTSPFVKPEHVDAAVTMLWEDPSLDSVTTMSELSHRVHPYNLSFVEPNGRWEFIFAKERAQSRNRQKKPPAQMFCNVFAARTETMLTKGRFGERKGFVLIDELYAWDIDFEWELAVAGFLLENGFVDLSHRMPG